MRWILFFACLPNVLFAQSFYSGTIVDKQTKVKIPFASVGLMKLNKGVSADEQGKFRIILSSVDEIDTLIISCVGYKILKVPAHNIQTNSTLELTQKITQLEDVYIFPKSYFKTAVLNDFELCADSSVSTKSNQTIVAQLFHAPQEGSMLRSVKICTMQKRLPPKKAIFRIRIFDIDTNSMSPSTDLTNQVIEVKSKSNPIKLNLEKYKIHIPGKDFFIGIEWIQREENEINSTTCIDNKVVQNVIYVPFIGFTKNKLSEANIWFIDYQNSWKKLQGSRNLFIAAHINY